MTSSTPLLPGEDHLISLDKAKEMTALFRAQKENILDPDLRGQNILSICETFNRSIFDTILAETGCVALRLYFGMNPELQLRVIIVGVDENNNDILPSSAEGKDGGGTDGSIGQEGRPCPDFCPDPPL